MYGAFYFTVKNLSKLRKMKTNTFIYDVSVYTGYQKKIPTRNCPVKLILLLI